MTAKVHALVAYNSENRCNRSFSGHFFDSGVPCLETGCGKTHRKVTCKDCIEARKSEDRVFIKKLQDGGL